MWALFTSALTRASSTTRVSIINTSSNFLITAILGLIIFSEKLPALWWVGAMGLVVGNVVIGRRSEEEADAGTGGGKGVVALEGEGRDEGYRDSVDMDGENPRRRGGVDDDVLELDGETIADEVDNDREQESPGKGGRQP
ncbi:MAG: hypothetical protein Q9183_004046 [Haloplaca sp. 2 TL-2023]